MNPLSPSVLTAPAGTIVVSIPTMFHFNSYTPAVLLLKDEILTNESRTKSIWYNVWTADKYSTSGGGYCSRELRLIRQFNGSDDIKNDILKCWNEREI